MSYAVYCIAKTDDASDPRCQSAAGRRLLANRTSRSLAPDRGGLRDMAHQNSTKAPEGAAAGAGTGALLGGALGWLVGIGALAIPGVGPLIAAGPILAALSGAALGGAARRPDGRPGGTRNSRVRGPGVRGQAARGQHPAGDPRRELRGSRHWCAQISPRKRPRASRPAAKPRARRLRLTNRLVHSVDRRLQEADSVR